MPGAILLFISLCQTMRCDGHRSAFSSNSFQAVHGTFIFLRSVIWAASQRAAFSEKWIVDDTVVRSSRARPLSPFVEPDKYTKRTGENLRKTVCWWASLKPWQIGQWQLTYIGSDNLAYYFIPDTNLTFTFHGELLHLIASSENSLAITTSITRRDQFTSIYWVRYILELSTWRALEESNFQYFGNYWSSCKEWRRQ